ncbi:MAG: CapA family protein [Candidatus Gracilibacteria bacterium]
MNKIKIKHRRIGALLLVAAIFLSGCSDASQANLLSQNLLSSGSLLKTEDIFMNQGPKYEEAYNSANVSFLPDQSLSGAIIAGGSIPNNYLAGFFKSLSKKQQYQHFVVLEPLPVGKDQNIAKIFHPNVNFNTPAGLLEAPFNFDELIAARPDLFQIQDFIKENNTINTFAPFIEKSFPKATYSVFLIPENIQTDSLKNFTDFLHQNLPPQTFVIAHAFMNSSVDSNLQDFQSQYFRNILENFDLENLEKINLNQTAAVRAFLDYAAAVKAQKASAFKADLINNNSDSGLSAPSALIEYFMEGPLTSSRNIYLVSFGDMMFGRFVRTLMDRNGLDYPFQKMNQSYLQTNDILLANLEGPIAKKSIQTSKTIAFRFLPDIAPLLKKYSFDVLSGANNHSFDMGINGYNDTRELIQAQGIKIFGNPKEVNDQSFTTMQIQDQKIAFLGLDDVDFKINDAAALNKVKDLVSQGYKVIPYIHWGIEYVHKPNDRQQTLAHQLIDAGAIAIIGMHSHVVQAYETYKGHPIFYSLGNAIFDQYFSKDTQEGLSLALIIANDQIQINFVPIRLDHSQMRLMTPAERQKFLETFATYGDYSGEEKAAILEGKLSLLLK